MKNPVSNVTIGTNLQQRQNLGRTRIRGWQNDVEYRLGPSRARRPAGYLFNNAKVTEFDRPNPALVGPVSAAGAEAPRLGQRGVREPARTDRCRQPACSSAASSTTT